ncbi:zwei Ig domain protein zig-8-like [Tigriopus californicus]|uniref:zwei Ig domain protein zig-8-like n=1 Tax=Tigriopus californicus TaxID=6832 RepID=UPI0027DA6281|nr:zwei Ig domain protein zig-8-like [Tigriopus californicus]XP_059082300.1 zwei Ig domain protein zig-8-like [Tigriopus californicus]
MAANTPQKLLYFVFVSLALPLVLNCKGQYEHFRNHESVFKEYQPYFEHEGSNMSTVAGQDVSFQCGVRNLGDRYVSWLRASDSQVLTTGWTKFTGDRRVKVIPADRSHTWGLGIRNVTPSDTGFYLCQVNTEPKITLRFHLSVTKSFAFIPGNNERYVQTGSQLELKCRISKTVLPGENPPIIEWTRNGTLEPRMGNHVRSSPAVFNKAQNSVESTLRIDSVTLDDSGIYKCTSNAASEATVTVLVTSGEQRAAIVEENSGRSGHSNLNKYLVVVCGLLPALLLHMRVTIDHITSPSVLSGLSGPTTQKIVSSRLMVPSK